MKFVKYSLLAAALLAAAPVMVQAQTPYDPGPNYWNNNNNNVYPPVPRVRSQRPSYSLALSRLRQARASFNEEYSPAATAQLRRAIRSIDSAIRGLQTGSDQAGIRLREGLTTASSPDDDDSLDNALELLAQARREVLRGESQLLSRSSQRLVVRHIDRARAAVQRAINLDD